MLESRHFCVLFDVDRLIQQQQFTIFVDSISQVILLYLADLLKTKQIGRVQLQYGERLAVSDL